jgi:hypothetical protein
MATAVAACAPGSMSKFPALRACDTFHRFQAGFYPVHPVDLGPDDDSFVIAADKGVAIGKAPLTGHATDFKQG